MFVVSYILIFCRPADVVISCIHGCFGLVCQSLMFWFCSLVSVSIVPQLRLFCCFNQYPFQAKEKGEKKKVKLI